MSRTFPRRGGEVVGRFGFFEVERLRSQVEGRGEHEVFVIHTADWVVIVAVTEDDHFVVVRQHRYGVDADTLEPAGGIIDEGEAPEAAARRELREETGYGGGELVSLGMVHPNPAVQGNRCFMFMARGVRREHEPACDEFEVTEPVLMSRAEVESALADGRITHALAVVALERALGRGKA